MYICVYIYGYISFSTLNLQIRAAAVTEHNTALNYEDPKNVTNEDINLIVGVVNRPKCPLNIHNTSMKSREFLQLLISLNFDQNTLKAREKLEDKRVEYASNTLVGIDKLDTGDEEARSHWQTACINQVYIDILFVLILFLLVFLLYILVLYIDIHIICSTTVIIYAAFILFSLLTPLLFLVLMH